MISEEVKPGFFEYTKASDFDLRCIETELGTVSFYGKKEMTFFYLTYEELLELASRVVFNDDTTLLELVKEAGLEI